MDIELTADEQEMVDRTVAVQREREPDLTAEVLVRRVAMKLVRQWGAAQREEDRQRLRDRFTRVLERDHQPDLDALADVLTELEARAPEPDPEGTPA